MQAQDWTSQKISKSYQAWKNENFDQITDSKLPNFYILKTKNEICYDNG